MDCVGVLRPLQSIFRIILLILLVSCNAKSPFVTLAFLGDINLARRVNPGSASFAYLFPALHSADLSLANLESPLLESPPTSTPPAACLPAHLSTCTPVYQSTYSLCAPASRASLLSGWDLDILSLANNHRFDCSPQGPVETVRLLTAQGLASIGPDLQPLYRQVHGLKLAFLAFDDVSAPLDVASALQAIHSARSSGALVVVMVHWGVEYQSGPTERQVSLAHQFAAAGAVLIVGSHPHVLQRSEWIRSAASNIAGARDAGSHDTATLDTGPRDREASRRDTLVLYSLGNALFDQPGLPDTRRSALVLVELGKSGVQSARAIPFLLDVPGSRVIAPAADTSRQIHLTLNLP